MGFLSNPIKLTLFPVGLDGRKGKQNQLRLIIELQLLVVVLMHELGQTI